MTRIKYPVLGLFSLLSIFSFCACNKQAEIDSWQLTPPTITFTNARGISLNVQATEFESVKRSEQNPIANETATLNFALQDHKLPLSTRITCSNGDSNTFEYSASLVTSEAVSILMILPPLILSPQGMTKDWRCDLRIVVTNQHGSKGRGELREIKFNFSNVLKNVSTPSANNQRADVQRRLICPTWWTEDDTSQTTANLHFESALLKLSKASRVNGVDSREWSRQPLCSVMETFASPVGTRRAELTGFFRPQFTAPRLSWAREFLIPNQAVPDLFHRPLLAWTIRNDDRNPQIIFIPHPAARLKLSAYLPTYPQQASWSKPTPAKTKITASGDRVEFRETGLGFYMRLIPGESARLVLSSNRAEIFSFIEFGRANVATHLRLDVSTPLHLLTLSNPNDIRSIATNPPEDLDREPRDAFLNEPHSASGSNSGALLDSVILEAKTKGAPLVPTSFSPNAAQSMGPDAQDCVGVESSSSRIDFCINDN